MPIQAKPVPSSGGKTSAILAPSKPAFRLHSRPADDWSSWEKRGKSLPNRSATYLSRMQATPAGRHCHCHCSEFGVDAPYAFHHAGDQYQQLRERVTAERNALHRRQQPSDVAQSAPRKTGAVASAHAKKDVTGVTTTSVRFDLDGEHSSHMQSAAPAGEDGSFAGDATFYRNDELAQRGAGSAGTPSDPSVSNSFVVISDNEPEVEVSVIEDELYGDARTPESGLASFSQTSKSVKPVTQFSSFVRHREERMVAVAYQHKLIEIHKIIRKMKKEHCACGPSAKVELNVGRQCNHHTHGKMIVLA